jgi:hypothetical protein
MRYAYLLAFTTVALVAVVLMSELGPGNAGILGHPPAAAPSFGGEAGRWFRSMKPYCNSVEVETRHRMSPPPSSLEGSGFSAACYALAGDIDRARSILLELPEGRQWHAAGVVFEVAHPVADAGDDLSAGPIMELVVEFWPNHYMALYHAGAARYALGDYESARDYLESFLGYYLRDDGWRRGAERILKEISAR